MEALNWNVRGGSGPGLERPGLHKEKAAAAAKSACTRARNSGEEIKKNKSREAGGGEEDEEADKRMGIGLERPGQGGGVR